MGMGRSCGWSSEGAVGGVQKKTNCHTQFPRAILLQLPLLQGRWERGVEEGVANIGMGGEGCAEVVGEATVVGWGYSAVGSACSMGSGPTRVLLLQHFLIAYTRGMRCTYPHIQLSSLEKVCGMHTRVKPQEHAGSSRARELIKIIQSTYP